MAAGYTALRLLQAPASEPVTVAQLKAHARIDNDYDDALLAIYIQSAREWAEQYLNRALFTQRWTFQITWAPPPTATPLVPQSLIVFPLNWPPLVRHPVEIPRAPCQSVQQVRWGPIDDPQVADPDDYTLNLTVDPGYLAVKPQLLPQIPQQSMQIDFTAGYDDSTALAVPGTIRHGILVLAAYYYEHRGDEVTDVDFPRAVYRLLDPHRLWTWAG